jgi:hypothetical protein
MEKKRRTKKITLKNENMNLSTEEYHAIIEKVMDNDFIFWLFPESDEEKTEVWEKHKLKIFEEIRKLEELKKGKEKGNQKNS